MWEAVHGERLVVVGEGPVEPQASLRWYLEAHPPTAKDPVVVWFGTRRTPPPFAAGEYPHCRIVSTMPGTALRGFDYTAWPWSYSQICRRLRDGSLTPAAVVACCTPVQLGGRRSLGGVNGYMQLALDLARVVVLEEVAELPHIPGAAMAMSWDRVVPAEQVDGSFGIPLSREPDEVDRAIAAGVARLVPDGPTLSIGVGRVGEALARQLATRSDVKVVCGAVTESTRALVERADPAQSAQCMSVIGSQDLLDWASRGPIRLESSTVVHSSDWLSRIPRFVTVLGGLQVDLAGNVNSNRVGEAYVSGPGGAPDFARGAHLSEGGLSIVALRSRSRAGASALVPELVDATVGQEFVDVVVTELGSAVLAGASPAERARRLEAIFH